MLLLKYFWIYRYTSVDNETRFSFFIIHMRACVLFVCFLVYFVFFCFVLFCYVEKRLDFLHFFLSKSDELRCILFSFRGLAVPVTQFSYISLYVSRAPGKPKYVWHVHDIFTSSSYLVKRQYHLHLRIRNKPQVIWLNISVTHNYSPSLSRLINNDLF